MGRLLVYLLVLALSSLGGGRAIAAENFISPAVQQQLDLSEHQIDIGIAALTFAKEVYPDLDIAGYSRKLDALADRARALGKGTLDPEQRIRVLNTVLFRQEGFRYDRAMFSRSRQEYYYLSGILDTKLGICYTMPLLYVAVAQRLGYPIFPVAAPDHLFARYVDPSFKQQNIETTSGGKFFPDEHYYTDFSVGEKGLKSGSYLRTMTYKEFTGHILWSSAFAFARRDPHKTLAYMEQAVKLNPRFADFHLNLGEGYIAKSKVVNENLAPILKSKGSWHISKAKQLGYVSMEEITAGRKIRGAQ